MDRAPNRLDERGLEIEEIVDAQSVTKGGRDIAHLGQVFAEGHHTWVLLASAHEEPSMRHQHQRPVVQFIPFGTVDVQKQILWDKVNVDVLSVQKVGIDHNTIESPCVSVAVSIALFL